jgi:hypothetical protein
LAHSVGIVHEFVVNLYLRVDSREVIIAVERRQRRWQVAVMSADDDSSQSVTGSSFAIPDACVIHAYSGGLLVSAERKVATA